MALFNKEPEKNVRPDPSVRLQPTQAVPVPPPTPMPESRVAHLSTVFVAVVFVKSGRRFSKKAVIASLASAERIRAENSSFSNFTACSNCSREGRFISLLQACNAVAGFSASF